MTRIGTAKIRIPATIRRGETITVKSLILHPMELPTRDEQGRETGSGDYIEHVEARYGGEQVVALRIGTGISANPFFAFRIKATVEAPVIIVYTDRAGKTYQGSVDIKFSGGA